MNSYFTSRIPLKYRGVININNITFANFPQGRVPKNSTNIDLQEITEAGAVTVLDNTDFANNSSIMVSATYFTD